MSQRISLETIANGRKKACPFTSWLLGCVRFNTLILLRLCSELGAGNLKAWLSLCSAPSLERVYQIEDRDRASLIRNYFPTLVRGECENGRS